MSQFNKQRRRKKSAIKSMMFFLFDVGRQSPQAQLLD